MNLLVEKEKLPKAYFLPVHDSGAVVWLRSRNRVQLNDGTFKVL